MGLTDLPPEIFEIGIHAVVASGIEPAWKQRLVSRAFRSFIESDVCSKTPLETFRLEDRGQLRKHSFILYNNLASFLFARTTKLLDVHPSLPSAISRCAEQSAALEQIASVTRRNQIKLDICNAIVAAAGFAKTITNIVQELDTGAIFLSTDDHAVQIIFAIAVDSLEAIQAIAKGNHVWEKSGILGSPLTYAALYAASPDAVAKLLDRVPTPVLAPAAHFEELKKILHQTLQHTLAKRLSLVSQQLLAWIGKHMSPCDRLEFEALLKHALESDDLITVEMVLTMKTVKKPKSLRWKLLEHALRTCPPSIGLLVAHGGLNPRQPGNSSAVMELAVELGAVDLVKTMLDFGADPNIPSPTDLTIKYVHRSYTQPLRIAVEAHHVDMVALLLQRGAILGGGIINNDLTLLKKAERYQDRRIYELLLAAQRREKLVQDADVI